jgi:hypothetical protein
MLSSLLASTAETLLDTSLQGWNIIIDHAFETLPRTPSQMEAGYPARFAYDQYANQIRELIRILGPAVVHGMRMAGTLRPYLVPAAVGAAAAAVNMPPRRKHPQTGWTQSPGPASDPWHYHGPADRTEAPSPGGEMPAKKNQKKKQQQRRANRPPVTGGQVRGAGSQLAIGHVGRGGMPLYKTLDDSVRIVSRSYPALTTGTTTGIVGVHYILGDDSSNSLDGALGKLATFYGMYDWTRIEDITFTFIPIGAYDYTGYVGMAIDPSPRAGAPTALTHVTRHTYAVLGDVKQPLTLHMNAAGLDKIGSGTRQWFTTDNNADVEWRAPAVFQLYASTNQTSGPTILGHLHIEARIAFKGASES